MHRKSCIPPDTHTGKEGKFFQYFGWNRLFLPNAVVGHRSRHTATFHSDSTGIVAQIDHTFDPTGPLISAVSPIKNETSAKLP